MGITSARDELNGCIDPDCGVCKGIRARYGLSRSGGVSLEKAEPVKPEPVAEEKMPRGLKSIRNLVTDYFTNPMKFIDPASAIPARNWNDDACEYEDRLSFKSKTFEDATGLVKLGKGNYSDVYALDETRVLKIVKKGDSGYARFVGLVRGSNNPHFPKIHYSGIWGGKQVYILERLEADIPGGVKRAFMSIVNNMDDDDKGEENPFITVAASVRECGAFLVKHKLNGDLHGENVMFRGNVPIVTDPCSEGH